MSLLETIIAQKQLEVAALKTDTRDFVAALRQHPCSVIAEYKRASPSKGTFAGQRSVEEMVQLYQASGAAAASILTDERFFQGELDCLRRARAACTLPILRKDFIIDPIQVYQSKLAGADAILLIARILSVDQLRQLCTLAHELDLQTLVEVHSLVEVERAIVCAPTMIGVNTRDLDTLAIRFELLAELRPSIPETICAVAESGISSAADFARARDLRYQAVLMGTAFMTASNPHAVVKQFTQYDH